MTFRCKIQQSELRQLFDYDLETGVFKWRVEPRPLRPLIGKIAGSLDSYGYRQIAFVSQEGRRRSALAHRLAWVYVNGSIPDGMEIDHIDCNRDNNSISNLRLATRRQQVHNMIRSSINKSGFKGASYDKKRDKWQSRIMVDGRNLYLGRHNSAHEAHEAYAIAAKKYFGEFARLA
jgi:hypothetical protein